MKDFWMGIFLGALFMFFIGMIVAGGLAKTFPAWCEEIVAEDTL